MPTHWRKLGNVTPAVAHLYLSNFKQSPVRPKIQDGRFFNGRFDFRFVIFGHRVLCMPDLAKNENDDCKLHPYV